MCVFFFAVFSLVGVGAQKFRGFEGISAPDAQSDSAKALE